MEIIICKEFFLVTFEGELFIITYDSIGLNLEVQSPQDYLDWLYDEMNLTHKEAAEYLVYYADN